MSCTITNNYDICITQNATFQLNFKLYDDSGSASLNATSWSFTGSIKSAYDSPAAIMNFTTSVLSYATASINLYLGAENTWQLGTSGSKFYYDVIAYNPTATPVETYRLMQGKVSINKGVTEP